MSVELKASVLRGYIRWLVQAGLVAEVSADVGEKLAAVIRDPPLPTRWLAAAETTLPIVESVARRRDLTTVRRMSREAAAGPILELFRPLVEGVIRLSVGPDGVVRRLPLVLGASARGITFEITDVQAHEARLVMRTHGLAETRASAEAWAGAVEAVLALAGVAPDVEVESVHADPATSVIRTRVGWSAPGAPRNSG